MSSHAAKEKFGIVMGEFEKRSLSSSSGEKVTDKDQALAIAYSEARKIDPNYGKSMLTGRKARRRRKG